MAKLKEGDKAPKFKVEDENGDIHKLSDYKGQKLVLYFYPRDLTPGCTTESTEFQANLTKFKRKKVAILGISRDTKEKHCKFIEKLGLKFPLLSDEDGTMCSDYGVWRKKKFMGRESMGIVRSTFIIDEKGAIVKYYDALRVKGHVDDVLASV